MDLKNKAVILTGGVNGIGKTLLKELITSKAKIGVFDIDKKGFDKLEIKNSKNVEFFDCDIKDYVQVEKNINEFYSIYNCIDILINNAGILYSAPLVSVANGKLKKHDIDIWNKVLAVNLSSAFYMTVNVVEKMIIDRTKGLIINVSSVASSGNAGQTAYSASKAGVNALTKTWAKELGLWGIRVFGVAPGFCETKSTNNVMGDEALKKVKSQIPIRRLGRPEEIAKGIFSAIDNDYFHGKILEIDGGLII
tara:strand:- start:688 stop:1440 length:753 start_codon:yes stop_codon:yes gene_type:complete